MYMSCPYNEKEGISGKLTDILTMEKLELLTCGPPTAASSCLICPLVLASIQIGESLTLKHSCNV